MYVRYVSLHIVDDDQISVNLYKYKKCSVGRCIFGQQNKLQF